jgi:hypothetical protein
MFQVKARAILAVLLAIAAATAVAASATDPAAGSAVWVEKDLSFTYMGFTSHYSCDGIRDKVRYVMQQVGARPGFKVTVGGCVNMNGPEIMPRVRVRAALPREATPEVLAELARERSRREMAAREQGAAPPPAVDASNAPFAAQWRTLQFRGTPNSDVQDGDCELLEQLVREVLVPMGVREVAGSRLNCVPHQVPIDAVNLKLQVLEPKAPPPARP